jgi:hypothetical protein
VKQLLSDAKTERAAADADRKALTAPPTSSATTPAEPTPTAAAAAAESPKDGSATANRTTTTPTTDGGAASSTARKPAMSHLSTSLQSPGDKEKELLDARQQVIIVLSTIKHLIYIASNFGKTHQQVVMA